MFTITAQVRSTHGKSASRRLRHENKLPAIVYGGNEDAISIVVDHDAMMNMQAKDGFYSEVLTLDIDGKATKVKVCAVQHHPFKPKMLHMDFVRA